VLVAGTTTCGKGRQDLITGRQLYEAGKFDEAYQAFSRAAAQDGNPAVRYNSGNAQYRMRHYLDATKSWQSAQGGTTRLKEWTWFNLGNAFLRADEDAEGQGDHLRRSIAAYEEALRIDPGDQEAKWNLELALRRRGDTDGPGSRGTGRGMAGRGRCARKATREPGNRRSERWPVAARERARANRPRSWIRSALAASWRPLSGNNLRATKGRRAQSGPTGDRDW
jgi:hypothetical protein